jgi:hypothetical protein
MAALMQNYQWAFIGTVLLPLVTGVILSFVGFEALQDRAKSDAQLDRIEKTAEQTLKQLPDINNTLATLSRYEQTLASFGERDKTLAAVLAQYRGMKHATEVFERFHTSKNHEERDQLASEVLDILSTNLMPVSTQEDLPTKPLILGLGSNTFRVLFSVPTRIPTQLQFMGLPPGTVAKVIENSKFGFTVVFEPASVPISTFGFIGLGAQL